jgi:hypothetical protein
MSSGILILNSEGAATLAYANIVSIASKETMCGIVAAVRICCRFSNLATSKPMKWLHFKGKQMDKSWLAKALNTERGSPSWLRD